MKPWLTTLTIILFAVISTGNAATKTTPSVNTKSWAIAQFLTPQNAARRAMRIPPLVWDQKLVQYAESYANKRKIDCRLEHSDGPYGENIFWGSGSMWRPDEAATAWVSEKRWYNYWGNKCFSGKQCGHYTQIVWKGTSKIGCARVICLGGKGVFMICSYDPPGNYIGERPY